MSAHLTAVKTHRIRTVAKTMVVTEYADGTVTLTTDDFFGEVFDLTHAAQKRLLRILERLEK